MMCIGYSLPITMDSVHYARGSQSIFSLSRLSVLCFVAISFPVTVASFSRLLSFSFQYCSFLVLCFQIYLSMSLCPLSYSCLLFLQILFVRFFSVLSYALLHFQIPQTWMDRRADQADGVTMAMDALSTEVFQGYGQRWLGQSTRSLSNSTGRSSRSISGPCQCEADAGWHRADAVLGERETSMCHRYWWHRLETQHRQPASPW